jgi:predicted nucleic acid-binding protein
VGVTLADAIPDGAAVLVDTAPIIYTLEANPLAARFESVFEAIDAGRIFAIVTPVTLAEVVAGPLRAGRDDLAERYRRAITTTPAWSMHDVDAELAMLAARMRLRHRLRLPDAIQLAAALREGCFGLVTHDRDFGSVTDLAILGTD